MRYSLLIAIVLGGILALLILSQVGSTNENFEDFALGKGTSAHFAHYDDKPIHIRHLSQSSVDSVIDGWRNRNERPVTFMFGNSLNLRCP